MGIYESILNNPTRLAIADFLNFEFINKGIWFFNIWSIIHLIFGGLLIWFLIFLKIKPLKRWMIFFGLIIIWEVFEIIMSSTTSLFIFEPMKDILWDIILAGIGAGILELILLIKKI